MLTKKTFSKAQEISQKSEIPTPQILIAHGYISQSDYLKALSAYFNVTTYQGKMLIAQKDSTPLIDSTLPTSNIIVRNHSISARLSLPEHKNTPQDKGFGQHKGSGQLFVICVYFCDLQTLTALIQSTIDRNLTCILTDRDSFRQAIENRYRQELSDHAINGLEHLFPGSSAKTALSHPYKTGIILLFITFFSVLMVTNLFYINPSFPIIQVIYWLGLCMTPFFIGLLLLRLWAIVHLKRSWSASPTHPYSPAKDKTLPVYTLLIPLFREERVLDSLIDGLKKLDYPPEKLDIKLLLEETDNQTQAKVQEMALPPFFEVIIVPDSQPQTKPKALNYGTTLCLWRLCYHL